MNKSSSKKYNVAILGWWYGKNYGSILTYYGLNRAITGLGHKVLMVSEALGYNGFRVRWPDDILSIKFAKRVGYEFTEQRHYSELPQLNEEVESFVVGSDQLWNPLIGRVNDDLFLDFVGPENRRVAYATSFGNRNTSKFKPEFIAKHSENLQKFSAISVRESYAVDTARDVFGVEATQVVDPVFLLKADEYEKLAQQATLKPSGDYLAVFFLDPTPEKRDAALAIADKLGLQKIVVVPNPDGGRKLARQLFADDRCEVLDEDSPENFLFTYSKARYVVTDSFHGTAFSVIFGKPFSSIYNTQRGADRFKSLLNSLGFGERRRVFEDRIEQTITNNPNVSFEIDFTGANTYIRDGRKMSMDWLKAALAPQSAEARSFLSSLKDKYQSLVAPGDKETAVTEKPAFTSNNEAWKITPGTDATRLSVVPGGAVRGNLVWCRLPQTLRRQQGYRLTVRWQVRTKGRAINLHARNPKTGAFRVIGTVPVAGKVNRWRTDSVDFVIPEDDFSEFMLGAVHFTGEEAGAAIGSLSLREIGTDQVNVGNERKPRARLSAMLKKIEQKTEIAIPSNTPDRSTIIANILSNPTVSVWKSELEKEIPHLTFYVAREMKEYANNKIGGPADILAFPKSVDEISKVFHFAQQRNIQVTVLGRGSNIIVRDGGVRGIVVMTSKLDYISIEGDKLTAGAGASLIETCYYLLDREKSGLEWAAGIPGSVGGAVFMNAGTNVSDVRRNIFSVKVLDTKDGCIKTITKKQISWGKRYTTFQDRKNLIILEATFNIKDTPAADLHADMIRTVQVRENHFPLQNPNHGSTFKWWRAPRLISQAGLVGVQIGGAQVSEKQPGFIVNVKQATASDFEALINLIIAKVYEFSGFLLEPEVEIIGERPHRYERYHISDDNGALDQR